MNTVINIKSSKGVTLIEVMVAIIITSIGILGFTSLQFLGLNSNQSAYSRSQASFIATSMSERMRANMDGVNANNYDGLDSDSLACTAITGSYCDERNNGGTAVAAGTCNAAQRAAYDFFVTACGSSSNDYSDNAEKTAFLDDLLPNGRIQITCNDSDAASATPDGDACTDFSDHTITITWQEQDEDATSVSGDNADASLRTRVATRTISYRFNP